MKVLPIHKLTDEDATWIIADKQELHDLRECVRIANLFIDDRFTPFTERVLSVLPAELRAEWRAHHTHNRAKLLQELTEGLP